MSRRVYLKSAHYPGTRWQPRDEWGQGQNFLVLIGPVRKNRSKGGIEQSRTKEKVFFDLFFERHFGAVGCSEVCSLQSRMVCAVGERGRGKGRTRKNNSNRNLVIIKAI